MILNEHVLLHLNKMTANEQQYS